MVKDTVGILEIFPQSTNVSPWFDPRSHNCKNMKDESAEDESSVGELDGNRTSSPH